MDEKDPDMQYFSLIISPSLIHYGCLVEALLLQDLDGLLTGDGGQDGKWGRQVQTLQPQVPPPDGQRAIRGLHTTTNGKKEHNSLSLYIPGFLHHDVLFPQEALLDHPLVIQELGP